MAKEKCKFMSDYIKDYDAIVATIQRYIDGGRSGNSEVMRPAFHPEATFVGYYHGTLFTGSVKQLFDWIDGNGPARGIEPRFASIEIRETIAVVLLEVGKWSGKLAGAEVRMSDVFTLIKTDAGWKISQKIFHWHSA
jgi:hypothetical protein